MRLYLSKIFSFFMQFVNAKIPLSAFDQERFLGDHQNALEICQHRDQRLTINYEEYLHGFGGFYSKMRNRLIQKAPAVFTDLYRLDNYC